ncbi:aminotransferase class V-fold PLP-dependent enzyme [Galbibacter mesophilus]|uniref:aminotransferase class V-fold PLP-dependent enzyme n=1 Tax=Galbibacter mesophilus TaxID=379069 RepID=UPI00191F0C76|nr:aminotransferase class V-fold PLP-dependent enzyme [Galbibacter mesophilus]MCM5661526.1 aminotransferase class V-fold PLP-dependent enzyme [Galbibacter mesophilus]
MTIEQFSKDFPLVSQYTYVNTAASGLLSEELMEWRQTHDIDLLIGGSKFRESTHKLIKEIRSEVAQFLDAKADQTVLVPNFSFALKTLVAGLDKDKSILLLEDDYPSLNWPFKSSGFKKVQTLSSEGMLEEDIEETFQKESPDVFAFSIVQYLNGIKIDLDFINRLKKEYPETIFIADGTQFIGTEKFSFEQSGIDVLGGSGYKWLLAGFGNGYMAFKSHMVDKLYAKSFDFEPQKEPFLQDKNHLQYHFEPGHIDTLNCGSLLFSIKKFNEIGIDTIENYLKTLSEYAVKRFSDLNLLSDKIKSRNEHSTIFSLKVNKKMQEELVARNVVYSVRGEGVRVSFHLYNTTKDIDRVCNILKHQ